MIKHKRQTTITGRTLPPGGRVEQMHPKHAQYETKEKKLMVRSRILWWRHF